MKLTQNIAKKYTTRYYTALQKFKHHQAGNEGTTETAFKDLLHNIALDLGLTLVKTTESISGKNNIIPDGIIKDDYFRIVGYWEAKDQEDNLDDEIYKKLKKGYPRSNTIFEDTEKAVLYQDNQEFKRYDLTNEDSLLELLITFFNYKEPVYEQFREAVEKFKENISRLSEDFKVIIKKEKSDNNEFKKAINDFLDVCKKSFHHRCYCLPDQQPINAPLYESTTRGRGCGGLGANVVSTERTATPKQPGSRPKSYPLTELRLASLPPALAQTRNKPHICSPFDKKAQIR